jgi:SWI/SNF-related matrix-associated actin-dependent regulator of chromatin subfamily A member 5
MAELATQGFGRWTKRHFQLFIKGLVEYGKDNFAGIAEMIGDRTEEEVKEYSEVFWKRYKELPGVFYVRLLRLQEAMLILRGAADWEKHIERIEAGEKQRARRKAEMDVLKAKVDGIDHPMQKLSIPYGQNKGKQYSEEEDRFLLVRLCHWGERQVPLRSMELKADS